MIDFIKQNKEWLFSGIGVSVLYVLWLLTKHIIKKSRHSLAAPAIQSKTSVPSPDEVKSIKLETSLPSAAAISTNSLSQKPTFQSFHYLPKPTPMEIQEELEKVLPFQRKTAEKNYIGLKVRWNTHLYLAHPKGGSEVSLGCKYEGYSRLVLIDTSLDDYPFLKVAQKGQMIIVYGTIYNIDPNGPELKADRLEFQDEDK